MEGIIPVEIKSGQTVINNFFKGVLYWNKLTQKKGGYVVYGGDQIQKRSNSITVISYKKMNEIEIM